MALTATTNSSTQTVTQSPQQAGAAGTTGTNSSSVQPGTATDLLNGQAGGTGGVPLNATALTTVNLGGATTTQTQAAAAPASRHINPALFSVSVVFFVIAVVLFWLTARSEKNTTK